MKTLLNGTSVKLIARWIEVMEKDIEGHYFYCIKSSDNHLCIHSVNKARLLVMYKILHISDIDSSAGGRNYFIVLEKPELLKEAEEIMLSYLQTMKALL